MPSINSTLKLHVAGDIKFFIQNYDKGMLASYHENTIKSTIIFSNTIVFLNKNIKNKLPFENWSFSVLDNTK